LSEENKRTKSGVYLTVKKPNKISLSLVSATVGRREIGNTNTKEKYLASTQKNGVTEANRQRKKRAEQNEED